MPYSPSKGARVTDDQPVEVAADLAAMAALLEIAEELSASHLLDRPRPFSIDELARVSGVPGPSAAAFLKAMLAAGLVEYTDDPDLFAPCAEMAVRRYEAGYLSWALNANRPYIESAHEFLVDPDRAAGKYHRNPLRVAVSSRWVGSQGFYPDAFKEIVQSKPRRVVDLGAGAGGLLVNLLCTLPESTGVAIDMSAAACEEAVRAASQAEVGDRLQVLHRTVESLVQDPSPLQNSDIVHAGFVTHDLAGDPETFAAILRACRESMAEGGRLVVVDAVPYAPGPRERAFSALFTYLHSSAMGVRLPTEDEWLAFFRLAGFTDVTCRRLRMPGSRLFLAAA